MARQHKSKLLPIHKPCACPRCRGVPTADAKWGYDEAAVPEILCVVCDQPIGKAAYLIDPCLARFGQMLFAHAACRIGEGGER